jgi:hypothetical protein
MNITPHQRTVDALLIETKGITLLDFIADRRDPESFKSYELIARDLRDLTDGIVDVVGKTIERWHQAYIEAAA